MCNLAKAFRKVDSLYVINIVWKNGIQRRREQAPGDRERSLFTDPIEMDGCANEEEIYDACFPVAACSPINLQGLQHVQLCLSKSKLISSSKARSFH